MEIKIMILINLKMVARAQFTNFETVTVAQMNQMGLFYICFCKS